MKDLFPLNFATAAVCVLLIATVVLIIIKLVKDKKNGKSSCDGNCIGCGCSDYCRKSRK